MAIDPHTGEVLVFVSTPAYDPNGISAGLSRKAYNALQEDIDKPLFNRALRGTYPPGSTIKPHRGAGGAALRHADPDEARLVRRRVLASRAAATATATGSRKATAPSTCRAASSSPATSTSTTSRGISASSGCLASSRASGSAGRRGSTCRGEKKRARALAGLEAQGLQRAGDQVWFPGETVITGIGQGYLLVTPVQLAHAAATIAARGQRFQPTMIHAMRDPITGHDAARSTPEALPAGRRSRIRGYWDAVIEGMHGVMQGARGTARAVGMNAPFQMAGKSGTAQVFTVAQNEKYKAADVEERMRDHALFVAFGPLEDPQIAVAVVVENGESGSKVAAPIARKVMEAYLRTGGRPPAPPAAAMTRTGSVTPPTGKSGA